MPSALSTIGEHNSGLDSDPTLTMGNGSSVQPQQQQQQQNSNAESANVTDVMNSTDHAAFGGDQMTGDMMWTWQMIVGVTCGSVIIAAIVVTVFIMFCYYRCHRRCCSTGPHDPFRFQNNSPQIWEDTVTLSYINAQFDLKDNSDEFASLENDTFLNSLESMMFHSSWATTKPAPNPGTTKL